MRYALPIALAAACIAIGGAANHPDDLSVTPTMYAGESAKIEKWSVGAVGFPMDWRYRLLRVVDQRTAILAAYKSSSQVEPTAMVQFDGFDVSRIKRAKQTQETKHPRVMVFHPVKIVGSKQVNGDQYYHAKPVALVDVPLAKEDRQEQRERRLDGRDEGGSRQRPRFR